MNYPAASSGASKTLKFCHSALDLACPVLDTGESRKQGKLTKPVLLSPDAHPLDSRFHGNDVRGYLTPHLTPPQADGVLKRNKRVSFAAGQETLL